MPQVPAAGVVRPPSAKQAPFLNISEALNRGILNPQSARSSGKKVLILDLDETLVHSSFKPPAEPSIVLPVEIDGKRFKVYVLVRPGAMDFLKEM
jgi:RNA polymerase II subunit A small phosphatase-like protein